MVSCGGRGVGRGGRRVAAVVVCVGVVVAGVGSGSVSAGAGTVAAPRVVSVVRTSLICPALFGPRLLTYLTLLPAVLSTV